MSNSHWSRFFCNLTIYLNIFINLVWSDLPKPRHCLSGRIGNRTHDCQVPFNYKKISTSRGGGKIYFFPSKTSSADGPRMWQIQLQSDGYPGTVHRVIKSYFEKVVSCLLLITESEKSVVTYHYLLSSTRLLITLRWPWCVHIGYHDNHFSCGREWHCCSAAWKVLCLLLWDAL